MRHLQCPNYAVQLRCAIVALQGGLTARQPATAEGDRQGHVLTLWAKALITVPLLLLLHRNSQQAGNRPKQQEHHSKSMCPRLWPVLAVIPCVSTETTWFTSASACSCPTHAGTRIMVDARRDSQPAVTVTPSRVGQNGL
jgi:hypothetical protein